HLARAAAVLVARQVARELVGEVLLAHQAEEGAARVAARDDRARAQLVAVREHDAARGPALHQDLLHRRLDADLGPEVARGIGDGVADAARAALGEAPG